MQTLFEAVSVNVDIRGLGVLLGKSIKGLVICVSSSRGFSAAGVFSKDYDSITT